MNLIAAFIKSIITGTVTPELKPSPKETEQEDEERICYDISSGKHICFAAEGYQWAQPLLKKHKNDTTFQITMPCEYQIDKGWPELPFVNVNTLGSLETEKDNWLGYIGGWEDNDIQSPLVIKLLEILEFADVILHGKIIKEEDPDDYEYGQYKVLFFVSQKSLDSVHEIVMKKH